MPLDVGSCDVMTLALGRACAYSSSAGTSPGLSSASEFLYRLAISKRLVDSRSRSPSHERPRKISQQQAGHSSTGRGNHVYWRSASRHEQRFGETLDTSHGHI